MPFLYHPKWGDIQNCLITVGESVNRHEVYSLLTGVLESYRKRPYSDVASLVGRRFSERVRAEGGEDYLLDVTIEWRDDKKERIRVAAIADSPGTFRLERMEESVYVTEDRTQPIG